MPQSVKNLPAIQETWVGKIPGGGHGNLLHYSCLESPQEQRKKYREVLYTLYSAFPQNSILPKYNIISWSGSWHWYSDSTSFICAVCVFVFSPVIFITCIDSWDHHYSQDTEKYLPQKSSTLHYVVTAAILPLSPFSSVQFSCSVVSDSSRPHESQHARPPGVHSNSRPLSHWWHPAISSSVVPFSSCPQSLPASEYFPMSQLFAWGGQSTRVSVLASFLAKNMQD